MTRIALLSVALLSAGLAAFAAPAVAKTLAYEDNKLNFKNCKGEDVSARWRGGDLTLSQAGKSPGDPAPAVEFQTWDGSCATFGWDAAAGALTVKQGDTTETGQALYFVAWDGGRWAAARTGAGFYLAKVADKGETDPKARLKSTGEWVAKNNKLGVPAADLLAEELTQAGGG
jgi:hypothetical protein